MPRINGTRGWALLVGGLFAITRGVAYLPIGINARDELPAGLQFIQGAITIEAWAGMWILIGLMCVFRAFSANDALAYGFLVGIMSSWGIAYFGGWVTSIIAGDPDRGWLTAGTYLGPALMVGLLSSKAKGDLRVYDDGPG